jgi:hypothetical protein
MVPTIQVEDGKGSFYVINESDFDAKKHKKFAEKKKAAPKKKPADKAAK